MGRMIAVKIDVTKIDKAYLFESQKTGAKYLDVLLMESKEKKYDNDFLVVQALPKADRDAGKKGAILGNGKYLGTGTAKPQQQRPPINNNPPSTEDSEVPF